jgi:hypothetical protein
MAIFHYSNSGVRGYDLLYMGVRTTYEAPEKVKMKCKAHPSHPANVSFAREDVN